MLRSCRTGFLLLLAAIVAMRAAATPAAGDALENVRRAQSLLGPDAWTRVIRIENRAEQSVYPREVVALVFEFAGILWFYTETDGTQSFSLHRNNLAAEKADFAPLLHDIDPEFAAYTLVPPRLRPPHPSRPEPLRNGCFIESIAALRERLGRGEAIHRAELLSYYAEVHGRRRGHTVLVYEAARGAFVFDPGNDGAVRIGATLPADALTLARRLRPALEIENARWVPALGGARLAGVGRRGEPVAKAL